MSKVQYQTKDSGRVLCSVPVSVGGGSGGSGQGFPLPSSSTQDGSSSTINDISILNEHTTLNLVGDGQNVDISSLTGNINITSNGLSMTGSQNLDITTNADMHINGVNSVGIYANYPTNDTKIEIGIGSISIISEGAITETASTGAYTLSANGIVQIDSTNDQINITANSDVNLTSNNSAVNITSAVGDVNLTSDNDLHLISNHAEITLYSASSIQMTAVSGDVNMTVTNGDIATNSKNVSVSASTGDITLYSLGSNVNLQADQTLSFLSYNGNMDMQVPNGDTTLSSRNVSVTTTTGNINLTSDYVQLSSLSVNPPVIISSTPYTVTALNSYLICSVAGSCVLNLSGVLNNGRVITVKTTTANTVSSSATNISPLNGGALVTQILPATIGKWATLVYSTTTSTWYIMQAN